MIIGAKNNLSKQKEPLSDGKIIAELNFGFWTKLLLDNHLNYRDMWRQIFINVFPYMEMSQSIDNEKKLIAMKLDNIRMFRR